VAELKTSSDYRPTGDQPKAIETLVDGLEAGERFQTLVGATGTGKTATMAWTIERVGRPVVARCFQLGHWRHRVTAWPPAPESPRVLTRPRDPALCEMDEPVEVDADLACVCPQRAVAARAEHGRLAGRERDAGQWVFVTSQIEQLAT
jgi:hypothetical protein